MEVILSSAEMAEVDRISIDEWGFPASILMENAGERIFQRILSDFPEISSAGFLIGKGNNGGDGLVIARKMAERNIPVEIFIFASSPQELSPLCLIHFQLAKKLSLPVYLIDSQEALQTLLSRILCFPFLIDAVLGTGTASPLHGILKNTAYTLNHQYTGKILAVDVPSGLSGKEDFFEPVIKASKTYCVEALKLGMTDEPGRSFCGKTQIVPIGFPRTLINHENRQFFLVQQEDLSLPKRPADSHKGQFGKTLIVGGSYRYPGAPRLALTAALQTGVGYVAYHGESLPYIMANCPEVLPLENFPEENHAFSSIAIGPGWDQGNAELLSRLLKSPACPLIADADAINLMARTSGLLKDHENILLTPHVGELARLIQEDPHWVKTHKISALKKFGKMFPSVKVLLKDSVSVLKWNQHFYFLTWGNSALARGGSGDLLTGLIAGFSAYHPFKESVFLACFLNGKTAELLSSSRTDFPISSLTLASHYYLAFQELRKTDEDQT